VALATEATRSALRTAEWLPVRDTPFFEYMYACSACGRECGGSRLTNYCGDCGSKMSVRRD
jgi:rRNA maturation endonuclease Nob1